MKPHQIISLMTFQGADNTLALADHYDHIHVGWRPLYGENTQGRASRSTRSSSPNQWIKLIDRLGEIDNPTVADRAVEVLGQGRQARLRRPRGRVGSARGCAHRSSTT